MTAGGSVAAALAHHLTIDRATATDILRRRPNLGDYSPETLGSYARQHRATLGVTAVQFLKMVVARPAVLTVPPETLSERYDFIRTLSPDAARVRRCLVANPHLLTFSASRLRENTQSVADALGMTAEGFAVKLVTYPQLAMYDGLRAGKVIGALVELLALPPPAVAQRLVQKRPMMMSEDPATIAQRFAAMREALEIPTAMLIRMILRCPQLLSMAPGKTANNLTCIADLLALTPTEAREVIARYPQILLKKPSSIATRIADLSQALSVPAVAMASVLVRQPQLVSLNPDATARKVALIASIADAVGTPKTTEEILSAYAGNLTSSVARLEVRLALAQCGLGPRSVRGLLHLSDEKVEALPRE